MIEIGDIRKSFGSTPVLDGVSFTVPTGSLTTVFGPNGCGKSTLMNILAGTERPDSGCISGLAELNHNIGFVFQDYRRSLLPWRDIEANILFPLQLRGISRREGAKQLAALLDIVQVEIDLAQPVYTLSGGQSQIVSLLRALITGPKLLILDEPFSALDYAITLSLRQKILETTKSLGLTTIFISHDLDEALYLGDKVVFLSQKPTRVTTELQLPFPFPRSPAILGSTQFAALKLQALGIFENSLPEAAAAGSWAKHVC